MVPKLLFQGKPCFFHLRYSIMTVWVRGQIHQLLTALKPGAGAEKDRFLECSFLLIFRLTLSAIVTII